MNFLVGNVIANAIELANSWRHFYEASSLSLKPYRKIRNDLKPRSNTNNTHIQKLIAFTYHAGADTH